MSKRFISLMGKVLGVGCLFYMTALPAHAVGMPQLDFSNPLITGQVIWGAGIFLVFYLLLSRALLPRVGKVLRNRMDYITSEAEKARAAKDAADRAFSEQQASLENARKAANDHLQKLLEKEHAESERIKQSATGRIKQEIADAEKRIGEEKAKVLEEMHEVATDVTQDIVYHFTGVRSPRDVVVKEVQAAARKSA